MSDRLRVLDASRGGRGGEGDWTLFTPNLPLPKSSILGMYLRTLWTRNMMLLWKEVERKELGQCGLANV